MLVVDSGHVTLLALWKRCSFYTLSHNIVPYINLCYNASYGNSGLHMGWFHYVFQL